MPYVYLTDEAKAAIFALSDPLLEWNPDENILGEVYLSEDILDRLQAAAIGDESISDTIIRLLVIIRLN